MARVSDERALWLARNVLPHEPALRSWLSGRQPPGLEIDDVIQETYTRLMSASNVERIQNIKAYTFQTAYSVIASHLRRAKVVTFQNFADMETLGATAGDASPEAQTIGYQELQRLAREIASLPGRAREVFMLRKVRGLSQREVARKLSISVSTVEKHMSRAILLLMNSYRHGGNSHAQTSKGDKGDQFQADGEDEQSRN